MAAHSSSITAPLRNISAHKGINDPVEFEPQERSGALKKKSNLLIIYC